MLLQLPPLGSGRYRELFEFPVCNYHGSLAFGYLLCYFEKGCDDFVGRYIARLHCCKRYTIIEELLATVKVSGKSQSIESATD